MRARNLSIAMALAMLVSAPLAKAAGEVGMEKGIECEIRRTVDGNMVRLEAMALADVAASGRYRFQIKKGGLSGVTDSRQGGAFVIESGQTRLLSTSTISVGPGDRYQAALSVEWDGETSSCSVEG
jgi:hypothetical protein